MTRSALQRLTALIPPSNIEPGHVDWPSYESYYNIRLPSDYKGLVNTYGPGIFCDDLIVWTPAPWPLGQTLLDWQDNAKQFAELTCSIPQELPQTWARSDGSSYPVAIDPASLFGWGSASDGEAGFWHMTTDNPDDWPVLMVDGAGRFDYHLHGLAAYIADLWSGGFPNRQLLTADLYVLDNGPYFTPQAPARCEASGSEPEPDRTL